MASRVLPSPTGGWNVKDSIATLSEDNATLLDNWFPDYGCVSVRPGYSEYITSGIYNPSAGTGGADKDVETLFEYIANDKRYFGAIAAGGIWDVTDKTSLVQLRAQGTYGSNRWAHAQMENSAGTPQLGLVCVNDEPPQLITDGGSTMAIAAMTVSGTGLTINTLSGINVYKSRSYFWTGVDQDFWYSATNAMGGSLTRFPLGRVNNTGGDLVAMVNWSVDGGDGKDDLAVFFLSSGDVLVYSGDDPSSSWSLQGVYQMGQLLNQQAMMRLRGDVVVATRDGYLPISANLPLDRMAPQGISDAITPEAVERARLGNQFKGWQIVHYPRRNMALVNVPLSAREFVQHVFNTGTSAAARFTNIQSFCWGLFDDQLYFGGADGKIYLFDGSRSDAGVGIIADAETAWSYMQAPSRRKLFTAVRPTFRADGNLVGYSASLGADFSRGSAMAIPAAGVGSGTPWGSAWGSAWSTTSQTLHAGWRGVHGSGYAGSLRLRVANSTQEIDWLSTNFLYETGGDI